jgi:hypothetical protein
MIVDITNEIFTNIKTTLTNVTVETSYYSGVTSFPFVSFEEYGNETDLDTIDTSGENFNVITFEINIFSNAKNKSTEVKTIRTLIDNIMSGTYRMTRTFGEPTPNFADGNIYRYTLRYTTKVDVNKKLYRG